MLSDNTNRQELYNWLRGLSLLTEYYNGGINPELASLSGKITSFGGKISRWGLKRAIMYQYYRPDAKIKPDAPRMEFSCEDYFSSSRIAVFMTVFGGYEVVRTPLIHPDNIDYYLITDRDDPVIDSSMGNGYWEVINVSRRDDLLPPEVKDPVYACRWLRMHPYLLFPEYEYSIYLDGSSWITSDLTPLIRYADQSPVAMFKHKNSDCVYEELRSCDIKRKDTPERLRRHKEYLQGLGIPAHNGLLETNIIVYRHNDPLCRTITQAWWNEFGTYSRRDQVALVAALWKLGIPTSEIGIMDDDFEKCNLFIRYGHRKDLGDGQ